MNPGGVGQDRAAVLVDARDQLDGFRQRPPKQLEPLLDDGLKPDRLALLLRAAAESENLTDQLRTSLARHQYLFDPLMGTPPARHFIHGQLRIAEDHLKNIVEVVRNSASQCAQGFGLLREPCPLDLGPLARHNIEVNGQGPIDQFAVGHFEGNVKALVLDRISQNQGRRRFRVETPQQKRHAQSLPQRGREWIGRNAATQTKERSGLATRRHRPVLHRRKSEGMLDDKSPGRGLKKRV